MPETLRTEINKVFLPVFDTKKQIIDLVGGRGRGASYFGTQYFLIKIIHEPYFRGVFMRRVFNDIRNSLFQDFKDRIDECNLNHLFKINSVEMTIEYIPNGNKIISKGVVADKGRTANLKSLAGFTHILMEEANEIDEHDFNMIQSSVRTIKAETQIVRMFNPPNESHWIWKDYNLTEEKHNIDGKEKTFRKFEPKSNTDILMIFSTYRDNIININEKTRVLYEDYKYKNPPYYYNQICGLISGEMEGQVYSRWQPITDKEFEEIECRAVYVIDFGYSPDPTALIQVKWKDNNIYVKELVYETELDDLSLAKRFTDLGITYRDMIIADYGNGGTFRIATFNSGGSGAWRNIEDYPDLRKGFSLVSAKKGSGSIASGIKLVQSVNVFMTESSVNGWEEYQKYIWATDRQGLSVGTPVDKYNHIMDCIRYFLQYKAVHVI